MEKKLLHNAYTLIPKAFRKNGLFIISLLVLSSVLDFFSLASFIPLIVILIDPEQLTNNGILLKLHNGSRLTDPMHFAIAITCIAVLFIFLKTAINNWITYRKATYAYGVAKDLASRALLQYLHLPYFQFGGIDYTREMNRIANHPLTFANNFIIPAGTMLAESLITSLLVLVIAFYEIKVFLFLLIILGPLAIIYRAKKNRIKNTSNEIKKIYPQLLKSTLQAVEGLPEVRAFKKEKFFQNRFNEIFQKLVHIFSVDHTNQASTSRITEVVASLCIGALIIYALFTGKSSEESVLLLSLYTGVSFRVIPSINRIFGAAMQMRAHEYVIEELSQMVRPSFTADESEVIMHMTLQQKIELQKISFGHEDHPLIFNNASLTIHKGEKILLLGRSGSGKTTLFLILMRFLEEQTGKILIDDKILNAENTVAFRKLMGYVSQSPYVLDASILENIAFGIPYEKINHSKVNHLIHHLDLNQWLETLPAGLNTIIGEKGTKLSGGQRQRLAIARALYHDAEILLLDEITNQLDRQTELEVMRSLDNPSLLNKTIILITHRPELWRSFDTVYELKGGAFEKVSVKSYQSSY